MTKLGTKLTEEHKKNIGKGTKRMWESGVFDSDRIRNIWRETALKGIAKKGKEGPNKLIPSQEMLDDLSKMGDKDFASKWNMSRLMPIKLRKRHGISSYNKQQGTQEHKIENGKEYKWCQNGHWELVELFGRHSSRWDGLRGHCKLHANQSRIDSYDRTGGAEKTRLWLQTETGRNSRSATMRKVYEKRRGCYVKFDLQDEKNAFDACNERCVYCKNPVDFSKVEFDHFIPVKLGGKTEVSNMLPACKTCNRSKRDKLPIDWLTKKFGQVFGEQIYAECVDILSQLGEMK